MLVRTTTAALFLLLIFGCEEESEKKHTIEPRGKEIRLEREVKAFRALSVPGKTQVKITRGDSKKAVLRGPENYLKKVVFRYEPVEVFGKKVEALVIELKDPIKPPLVQVELQTPELTYMNAEGPARIEAGDFSGAELTLRADDASRIQLSPSTYGKVDFEVAGSALVLAKQVMIEEAHLRAYGGGRISVGQVALLKKEVDPKAMVAYAGTPEIIK